MYPQRHYTWMHGSKQVLSGRIDVKGNSRGASRRNVKEEEPRHIGRVRVWRSWQVGVGGIPRLSHVKLIAVHPAVVNSPVAKRVW